VTCTADAKDLTRREKWFLWGLSRCHQCPCMQVLSARNSMAHLTTSLKRRMAAFLTSLVRVRKAPSCQSRQSSIRRLVSARIRRRGLSPTRVACVRPDPWRSPDIVTTNLDACLGPASVLKGEQTIDLPREGSEQYAAQSAHFFILTLTICSAAA